LYCDLEGVTREDKTRQNKTRQEKDVIIPTTVKDDLNVKTNYLFSPGCSSFKMGSWISSHAMYAAFIFFVPASTPLELLSLPDRPAIASRA
jgi:hypothetical protein